MIAVKDINLGKVKTPNNLIDEMRAAGGFSAKKVAVGVDILESMIKDKACTKILSMPGAPISTGLRGVIKDLVKNKLVDVIITTCGLLDHDYARVWKKYYHGDFALDDKKLHKRGINRLGNVLIPNESYGIIIEDKVTKVLEKIYKSGRKVISSAELCHFLGESLQNEANKESSILYWAWKNSIPIFVPGITDGAVGSQAWFFSQKNKDFKLDVLADEDQLAAIAFDAKKLGALIIGGGISKHHTIWWAQFHKGLEYAVYITTAVEYDGSLSGAQTREAISWGKLKEAAKHITIEGEATILLPLMVAALMERL
ncbi:MAG: deoxyhypusine synthase [Candidatus Nanoarchaeia archaeon]